MTAFMGIFGAAQEARAAREANRILNQAREEATKQAHDMTAMFTPFVERGARYFDETEKRINAAQQTLQEQAGQIEVGQGLTAADEIAYKDAARLLNENMVGTGNLRSGAAAYGQSELLRRVVADANQRNFTRRIAKLQLLYGGMSEGASQYGNMATSSSGIGLQGNQIASGMLQNALGFAPMQANAAVNRGRAYSNELMSYGVFGDEIKDTAREAWGDFLGGVEAFGGAKGMAGMMGGA